MECFVRLGLIATELDHRRVIPQTGFRQRLKLIVAELDHRILDHQKGFPHRLELFVMGFVQ